MLGLDTCEWICVHESHHEYFFDFSVEAWESTPEQQNSLTSINNKYCLLGSGNCTLGVLASLECNMLKLDWQSGVQMKGWDLCVRQCKGCAMSEELQMNFL